MLRNLFTGLLCGGAAFALAACCGSVACDKQDDYADALLFRFNLDRNSPLGGFSPADVDTVYLRRHTIPASSAIKSTFETVQLVRLQSNAAQSITLNNNTPFTYTNSLKLNGYRYTLFVLRYPATSKPKIIDTVRYSIDNIRLAGNYQGDGCCTYYENTSKTADVSEMKVDGVRTNTYPSFNFKGPNRDQNVFVLNRY